MENLRIEGSSVTPKVHLDARTGVLEIGGYSRPENARDFYLPILHWLDRYKRVVMAASDKPRIVFNFRFIYFNSSSAKFIYDIIIQVSELTQSGYPIDINWYYDEDDDELREAGEELSDMSGVEFKYFEVKRH